MWPCLSHCSHHNLPCLCHSCPHPFLKTRGHNSAEESGHFYFTSLTKVTEKFGCSLPHWRSVNQGLLQLLVQKEKMACHIYMNLHDLQECEHQFPSEHFMVFSSENEGEKRNWYRGTTKNYKLKHIKKTPQKSKRGNQRVRQTKREMNWEYDLTCLVRDLQGFLPAKRELKRNKVCVAWLDKITTSLLK